MTPKKKTPKANYICERTATVLEDWTSKGGSQKGIADASGLSPSLVSLFFRGRVHPERDTFEKLAEQFDSKTRAALLEAYVIDGLTPRYQELVSVRVRDLANEPSIVRDEAGSGEDEIEQHFSWLRRMVKTRREWRDWFLNNMRMFRRSDKEV